MEFDIGIFEIQTKWWKLKLLYTISGHCTFKIIILSWKNSAIKIFVNLEASDKVH